MTVTHHHTVVAGDDLRVARLDHRLRLSMLLPLLLVLLGFAAVFTSVAFLVGSGMLLVLGGLSGLFAMALLVGWAALWWRIRRVHAGAYPEGLILIAEYGSVLRVVRPSGEVMIPYPHIRRIVRSGAGVLLVAEFRGAVVLPVELCPPAAAEFLDRARREASVPEPRTEGFPVSYEVSRELGPDAVLHIARVFFRQDTTLVAAGAATVAAALALAALSEYSWWQTVLAVVVALTLLGAGTLGGAAAAVARTRRLLASAPVRGRFDEDTFTVLEGGSVLHVRYDALREVSRSRSLVAFSIAGVPEFELHAAGLFPEEMLARLS